MGPSNQQLRCPTWKVVKRHRKVPLIMCYVGKTKCLGGKKEKPSKASPSAGITVCKGRTSKNHKEKKKTKKTKKEKKKNNNFFRGPPKQTPSPRVHEGGGSPHRHLCVCTSYFTNNLKVDQRKIGSGEKRI